MGPLGRVEAEAGLAGAGEGRGLGWFMIRLEDNETSLFTVRYEFAYRPGSAALDNLGVLMTPLLRMEWQKLETEDAQGGHKLVIPLE